MNIIKKINIKPKNIGQYLYKEQRGVLEKLFPRKSMKEIRKIIKWEY